MKKTKNGRQKLTDRQRHANQKRKFARYPSCLGDLDTRGIYNVAIEHGMEVIRCYKPDMCCWNSVALYGTAAQMEAVEAAWNAAGNETERGVPKSAWPVSMDIPREQWSSVMIEAARKNKISNQGGTIKARTRMGMIVTLPPGYRVLNGREVPKQSDIAWNDGAEQFEPIDWEDVEKCGKRFFKNHANLLARKSRPR